MTEGQLLGLKVKSIERIAFLGCVIFAAYISFYFHNKFWWGPDDAYYGYIAQRMLAGDVLNKDFQTLHPGAIYFVNAFFMKLTDGDIVGMRYPLILITVLQTALVFLLVRPYGLLSAVAASVTLTAFSFIQFINPTANWYTLCIAVIVAYILTTSDAKTKRTLLTVGFLVGLCFMFRQLTGIFLSFAVTIIIFIKNADIIDPMFEHRHPFHSHAKG